MKQNTFIKLKAAFLLMVFALNTVVAFACSMGVDMGYNGKHHAKEAKASANAHSHTPGTGSHQHDDQATHSHDGNTKHSHAGTGSHSHNKQVTANHQQQSNSEQDDCCTGNAIKFQTEDKKLQKGERFDIKAPVFVAFLSAFLGVDVAPQKISSVTKFLVPQFYPPPDIRIAIQSFLI